MRQMERTKIKRELTVVYDELSEYISIKKEKWEIENRVFDQGVKMNNDSHF